MLCMKRRSLVVSNIKLINEKNYLEQNLNNMSDKEIEILDNLKFDAENKNKKLTTKLPENCGITVDMIPKYCYYSKARGSIGEHFVIDCHPKLNTRSWSTQTTTKVTLKEKFDQLINKINELNI